MFQSTVSSPNNTHPHHDAPHYSWLRGVLSEEDANRTSKLSVVVPESVEEEEESPRRCGCCGCSCTATTSLLCDDTPTTTTTLREFVVVVRSRASSDRRDNDLDKTFSDDIVDAYDSLRTLTLVAG